MWFVCRSNTRDQYTVPPGWSHIAALPLAIESSHHDTSDLFTTDISHAGLRNIEKNYFVDGIKSLKWFNFG